MFTGLVQAVGKVQAVRKRRGVAGVRLEVLAGPWDHRPSDGDSISVSGCCLTVVGEVDSKSGLMRFDVVPETLSKTRLGRLSAGDRVNLEHAATATTLLGGHVVQGHVDGVAEIVRVARGSGRADGPRRRGRRSAEAWDEPGGWRVRLRVPAPGERRTDSSAGDLMQYIVPKGSVTVDGVSLTVASLWHDEPSGGRGFEVALIPATLAKTTLKDLWAGDWVNLEVDALAKTVVHWLRVFGGAGSPPSVPSTANRRKRAHSRH